MCVIDGIKSRRYQTGMQNIVIGIRSRKPAWLLATQQIIVNAMKLILFAILLVCSQNCTHKKTKLAS